MTAPPAPPAQRCSTCGAPFVCGAQAGLPACWCAQGPKLPADVLVAGTTCLCPDCLARRLAELASQATSQ